MKFTSIITNTATALGLSAYAMAGTHATVSEIAAAPQCNPWTVEASLLYLQADSNTSGAYQSQDFEPGYRAAISYQSCEQSIGYRFTYLYFQGTQLSGKGVENGPEINTFDLEAFKSFTWGSIKGQYSLGARYFDLKEAYISPTDVNYSGFGPVAGIELTKELVGPYSVYATSHVAYIFGDDKQNESKDNSFMCEVGAGIQRDLQFCKAADGYVRLGVEYHYYDGMTYSSGDASLFGGVLSIGVRF